MTREVFRGTYGGRACTLRDLGERNRYGRWYMCFDQDPGCGPMAFPVSCGVWVGPPVKRCPGCNTFVHTAAWPCTLPHGPDADPLP